MGHDHKSYDNSSVNLHEYESECSICFTTRNTLDLNVSFFAIIISLSLLFIKRNFIQFFILVNSPYYVDSLRGPPIHYLSQLNIK